MDEMGLFEEEASGFGIFEQAFNRPADFVERQEINREGGASQQDQIQSLISTLI
jgi:hypothetical protein